MQHIKPKSNMQLWIIVLCKQSKKMLKVKCPFFSFLLYAISIKTLHFHSSLLPSCILIKEINLFTDIITHAKVGCFPCHWKHTRSSSQDTSHLCNHTCIQSMLFLTGNK